MAAGKTLHPRASCIPQAGGCSPCLGAEAFLLHCILGEMRAPQETRNKAETFTFLSLKAVVASVATRLQRQVGRDSNVFGLPDLPLNRETLKPRGSAHIPRGSALQQTRESSLQQNSPSVSMPIQRRHWACFSCRKPSCGGGLAGTN